MRTRSGRYLGNSVRPNMATTRDNTHRYLTLTLDAGYVPSISSGDMSMKKLGNFEMDAARAMHSTQPADSRYSPYEGNWGASPRQTSLVASFCSSESRKRSNNSVYPLTPDLQAGFRVIKGVQLTSQSAPGE